MPHQGTFVDVEFPSLRFYDELLSAFCAAFFFTRALLLWVMLMALGAVVVSRAGTSAWDNHVNFLFALGFLLA
jgi:hypothetical protein